MSDLLSEDQIARLFDQAAKGKLPEDLKVAGGTGGPQKRARGLRTIDFQHPTKFTADQERRIKRALEQFCRTANRRLSRCHFRQRALLSLQAKGHVFRRHHQTWRAA